MIFLKDFWFVLEGFFEDYIFAWWDIESLVRSPTHHNTISVEVGLTSRFLGKLVKLILL
jgi:hypothetical protein